jgi:hypothetical protein
MFFVALLVLGLTVGVAGALRLTDSRAPRPQLAPPPPSATVSGPAADVLEVLHDWDRRRARAWASGDPRSLRALYTPASVAGRRDAGMLRRWTGRGLAVRGMRMQVLDGRVRVHSADRLVVEVTDRLIGAVAVGRGVRRELPADLASTWAVTLRRVAGEWRVAAVRSIA